MNAVAPAVSRSLLVTTDLHVAFERRGRRVTAVAGLSYRLEAGRTLAIVGESGAGKTAGCRALLGLLPPTAIVTGSAKLEGTELIGLSEKQLRPRRGADIAIVFQDPARSLNPVMCVGAQIAEAIRVRRRIGRDEAHHCAVELLHQVRLRQPARQYHAYPHQLSGGMRQRVLIAIALAGRPKVLIADEATKSLDVTTQAGILELLGELRRERDMAVLMICHDLRLAAAFADEVLVMQSGKPVEYGSADRVLENPQTSYTRRLLDAVPRFKSHGPTHLCAMPVRSPARTPLLAARSIGQQFVVHGRIVPAVSGVSFDIHEGETLGLVGETGSGKSTLARSLLQIPRPMSGSVLFRGQELTLLAGPELRTARRHLQMVFQDPFGSLNPKWRVGEIIEEPLRGHRLGTSNERRRKVDALLDCVGLPPDLYRDCRPRELSGGQCQRVAIARALAPEPALIICDEAVASLDVLIQKQIIELLARLRETRGLSYLFISHDLALVATISHRVAVMYHGRLCEIGPTAAVYRQPRHPYTAALLASIAAASTVSEHLHREEFHDRPSADDESVGCCYHARCPRAERRCAREVPPLREVGESHFTACHFQRKYSRGSFPDVAVSGT